MKTTISRFQIHDELTAPDRSMVVLQGVLSGGGQLPNFLGALANSPAALRAYARFRAELRHGSLSAATTERIALAVASHDACEQQLSNHVRIARSIGLPMDEIMAAQDFDSNDAGEAALLRYIHALVSDGAPPVHLHEEAHEAGWDDEQLLEAIATVAFENFAAMVQLAGDIPFDGSSEQSRLLKAA